MQRSGKASGSLYMHETVINLKSNYSCPGRSKKKKAELGFRNLIL